MRSVQKSGALVVLTIATLLMAPVVTAQETSGAIRGTVADEYGTPIAGAVVEAVGPVGTVSTTSDGQGEYRFPRVAAGDYRVSSKFEGYIDATADIRVVLGEAVTVEASASAAPAGGRLMMSAKV